MRGVWLTLATLTRMLRVKLAAPSLAVTEMLYWPGLPTAVPMTWPVCAANIPGVQRRVARLALLVALTSSTMPAGKLLAVQFMASKLVSLAKMSMLKGTPSVALTWVVVMPVAVLSADAPPLVLIPNRVGAALSVALRTTTRMVWVRTLGTITALRSTIKPAPTGPRPLSVTVKVIVLSPMSAAVGVQIMLAWP